MNNDFTRLLGDWLGLAPEKRDYAQGAEMLLRLSANRARYMQQKRYGFARCAGIIERELQRYYNHRVGGLTHEIYKEAEAKALEVIGRHTSRSAAAAASESNSFRTGKRDDHDRLPAEIQALYEENASVRHKIRRARAELERLSLGDSPCKDSDRLPVVKEVLRLDDLYRQNWARYDGYVESVAQAPLAGDGG